ncbi:GbsR/MarR family transcriptional regulator [Pseudooceanicola sp. HF7]|uniref:GbsR/MarR family transcriptional regulator n=1 Tax=Pseudooceanicola sp. HF7 TaxID=2721560 RepID=UPI00158992F6|nr:transcriptional regulator [Pseudooceanicola sp. HF7]
MSDVAIEKFIETMGSLAQSEGGTRIAGQILGYLVVEGEPRTLTQMTEALSISKASASTNARLLENRGQLRRVSQLGSRQDAWEAVSNPNRDVLATVATRFRKSGEAIGEAAAAFPPDRAEARSRVVHLADFYFNSAEFIEEWISNLPDRQEENASDLSTDHGAAKFTG